MYRVRLSGTQTSVRTDTTVAAVDFLVYKKTDISVDCGVYLGTPRPRSSRVALHLDLAPRAAHSGSDPRSTGPGSPRVVNQRKLCGCQPANTSLLRLGRRIPRAVSLELESARLRLLMCRGEARRSELGEASLGTRSTRREHHPVGTRACQALRPEGRDEGQDASPSCGRRPRRAH